MSLLRKTFHVAGELTNMTSVKLSDVTGTFGVKRNDTGAVVVPDGTEMTNVSLGVYEYEFEDPDYDLYYTYVLEVAYAGDVLWAEDTMFGPTAPAGTAGSAVVAANLGQISYYEIIERVSDFLGYGLAPAGDELTRVRARIEAGYRRFLDPPVLPREVVPHEWSWLSPLATLDLSLGVYRYTLPFDFGGIISDMNYAPQASLIQRVSITHEGVIRKLRANNDQSGDPYTAAVRALSHSLTSGQLWELVVYPTPIEARTLYYRYKVGSTRLDTPIISGTGTIIQGADGTWNTLSDPSADFLGVTIGDVVIISAATGPLEGMYVAEAICPSVASDESTSPSGASASASPSASGAAASGCTSVRVVGDSESGGTVSYEILPQFIYPKGECPECLVESCLAAAELQQDDTIGIHQAKFTELLIACVIRDRMKHSQELGYCGDASDDLENGPIIEHEVTGVTYDGVVP